MGGETARDLQDLTRDWFLFLSTCRRQAGAIPAQPEWMREKLDDLLADMEAGARHDPRLEAALEKARYPLVYLADEILLTSGWPGEAEWAANLYETRKFGTQHAGLDFFTKLDEAMAGDREDLLGVFFKALCLGFRGKLLKQPEALHNLRKDLYRRTPSEKVQGQRFCTEAYDSTDERSFVKLPVVVAAKIVIPLVALLIAAWLIGTIVTREQLADIDQQSTDYVDSDGED